MWRFRSRFSIVLSIIALGVAMLVYRYYSDMPSPPSQTTTATPPLTAPTRASKATNETDRLILSLFDSEIDKNGLAFEQQLRDRYRNAYIGIYLLQGCNRDITVYHEKLSASFRSEWAKKMQATPVVQDIRAMQAAIIEEARTSYSMLYTDTPCEKRNLDAFIRFFDAL